MLLSEFKAIADQYPKGFAKRVLDDAIRSGAKDTDIVHVPQPGPQYNFIATTADIALYGGGAGGGKTYGLLHRALGGVAHKHYNGVIFRRTTREARDPGGLWDESQDLYLPSGAKPREKDLQWTFNTGAKIKFAHLEYEKTKRTYQGLQCGFLGFDELTHFTESQFTYMFSRNRDSKSPIKSVIRATCNPDADSWVKKWIQWYLDEDAGFAIPDRSGVIRYFAMVEDERIWGASREELLKHENINPEDIKSFTFIVSGLQDNQMLVKNDPSYLSSLKALPLVERERLWHGNWNIRAIAGNFFKHEWYEIVKEKDLPKLVWVIRAWDLAGSELETADYTAGVCAGLGVDRKIYILDSTLFRATPHAVRTRVRTIGEFDKERWKSELGYAIHMQQDPAQAGKDQAQIYKTFLSDFRVLFTSHRSAKEERMWGSSAATEQGAVKLLEGPWNQRFKNNHVAFHKDVKHDDEPDAANDAIMKLHQQTNKLCPI